MPRPSTRRSIPTAAGSAASAAPASSSSRRSGPRSPEVVTSPAGRPSGGLAARVATAALLIALLLAALFLLPRPWLVALLAGVCALAGFEWARLCRFGAVGAWAYAGAMAFGLSVLYNTPPWQPAFPI